MSTTPLVLYQAYLAEGEDFSVQASSSSILTGMVKSRFIGREHGLLVLDRPFHDLADRVTTRELKRDRATLSAFCCSRQCDAIVVLNTHSSTADGGLMYGRNKTTSLPVIMDYLLGEEFPHRSLRKTVLFILSCGAFVEHSVAEIRSMSSRFSAVFAFGAPILDPILVTSQFVTSIVDYYCFGQEPLWTAIHRTLKQEVMKHTSIYIGSEDTVQRIADAPWRRKPNGEDVRCCEQVAKYMGTSREGRIRFRCRVAGHVGTRTFYLDPMPSVPYVRRFWGGRGGPRYMISYC
ncbi:hypothetical protein C8Q76DRAFT_630286 [Earliella scabrosa]|nr:hypothetical protein C8Q76DRAFT_630286 [Earliella scabrosa]